MAQLSYVKKLVKGQAGQLADDGVIDVLSRVNPSVDVNFGVLVVNDVNDGECKLPGAAADITAVESPLGVAMRTHAIESQADGDPANYPMSKPINVLHKGRVLVTAEEAVVKGDPVFVRYVAGSGQLGGFRMSDPGTEAAQLAGARWMEDAGAGALAVLELDL